MDDTKVEESRSRCKRTLDIYIKQIRCIMELAVAVWELGLTENESTQIERVQKVAFHIFLGHVL